MPGIGDLRCNAASHGASADDGDMFEISCGHDLSFWSWDGLDDRRFA